MDPGTTTDPDVEPTHRLVRLADSIRLDRGVGCSEAIAFRFIERSEPNQDPCIERFNRRCSTEVLDAYLFHSIEKLQPITEVGVLDEARPDDDLGGLSPRQFVAKLATAADARNGLST